MSGVHSNILHPRTQDLTGRQFGRWTVLAFGGYIPRPGGDLQATWSCSCHCGTLRTVIAPSLLHHLSQSCGCLRVDRTRASVTTHGQWGSPEYWAWHSMLQRCYNTHHKQFHDYGGRHIAVCEPWRVSFAAFFADLGPRPTPQHTLERLDNNQGYFPGNVTWATRAAQQRNRRVNHWITWDNETLCLSDWATRLGLGVPSLLKRLRRWSLERVMTTPPQRQAILITWNEETLCVAAWARRLGISEPSLLKRLRKPRR